MFHVDVDIDAAVDVVCYYIGRTTGALWRQSEVFLVEVSAFWARLALQLPNIHRMGATFWARLDSSFLTVSHFLNMCGSYILFGSRLRLLEGIAPILAREAFFWMKVSSNFSSDKQFA